MVLSVIGTHLGGERELHREEVSRFYLHFVLIQEK